MVVVSAFSPKRKQICSSQHPQNFNILSANSGKCVLMCLYFKQDSKNNLSASLFYLSFLSTPLTSHAPSYFPFLKPSLISSTPLFLFPSLHFSPLLSSSVSSPLFPFLPLPLSLLLPSIHYHCQCVTD